MEIASGFEEGFQEAVGLLKLLWVALLDQGLDLLAERLWVSFPIVRLEECGTGNVLRACQGFDLIRRRPFLISFDLTKIVGAYVRLSAAFSRMSFAAFLAERTRLPKSFRSFKAAA